MAGEDLSFQDLQKTVEPLVCKNLTTPAILKLPLGLFTPATLPLQDMSSTDNPSVNLFDIITDYRGAIDVATLSKVYKTAVLNSDVSSMPEPFGFRGTLARNTKLQLPDGSNIIVKHFTCPDKLKPSVFLAGSSGQAYIYRWRATHAKVGKKILQYTLESLGGQQFKMFEMQSYTAPKSSSNRFEDKTDEEIDAGFDFIVHDALRSSSEMQQLRWMTKTLKNPQSPIFNWPGALVEKALRNLSQDGSLAKKEMDWPIPLTSTYYHGWVLELLEEVWDFDTSALVMLGEAGAGKSPLGRSILMAQARFNKAHFGARTNVCIRCTPEIDFLRGEQGNITMGDFLDDTCLSILSSKMLKSLLDVGLYEAMAWARWGAVKWVQNQPRAVADNTYEPSALPDEFDFVPSVPFDKFEKCIRPAFNSEVSKAHMDAIFKRTVFLVNSPTHVYFRKAGINTDPVPRVNIERPEYLTEAGRTLYGTFKDGTRVFPPDHAAQVRREQDWVTKVMEKRLDERSPDYKARQAIRRGLWGPDPASSRSRPIFRQVDAMHKSSTRGAVDTAPTIKRERVEQEEVSKKARIWALELKASNSAIDLDSPDRNKSDLPSTAVPNPDDMLNDYMDVVSEDEADVLAMASTSVSTTTELLLSYRVVLSSLSRPVQCPATLFKRIPLGTSR